MSTKTYNLICMSFDGDYITEQRGFTNIGAAWDRSNDMGSRWFFYPFHFVVTPGGTIASAPDQLEFYKGKRVKTVQKIFETASKDPETKNFDPNQFVFYLWDQYHSLEG